MTRRHVDRERLFVASTMNDAERVVESGAIAGALDLPQSIERLGFSGGTPLASSRRSTFEIDGPMAYLAVRRNGEEVQQFNLAVAGAMAIPSTNPVYTQTPVALDPSIHIDAVVLAFGTNDTNFVSFPFDPSLCDSQIATIVDHIQVQSDVFEERGSEVYVATRPPRVRMLFGGDGYNERIVALNDGIRARFPERPGAGLRPRARRAAAVPRRAPAPGRGRSP